MHLSLRKLSHENWDSHRKSMFAHTLSKIEGEREINQSSHGSEEMSWVGFNMKTQWLSNSYLSLPDLYTMWCTSLLGPRAHHMTSVRDSTQTSRTVTRCTRLGGHLEMEVLNQGGIQDQPAWDPRTAPQDCSPPIHKVLGTMNPTAWGEDPHAVWFSRHPV